jgi:N4-(beta-N-acetylglucosaminyl)-L-asparaginase
MSVSRRDFLGAGAAAAAGLTIPKLASAMPMITVRERSELIPSAFAGRPTIISAANGYNRDPQGKRGIEVAWDLLSKGGDPLDAVVAGVQIVELDPKDNSVGLGGLPNEEGIVQLDASVMHGPTRRAGSVGAIEDIATPAAVARDVMTHTDHIMLAGAGAKKFALEMGYKEQNLLTPEAREMWIRWKSKLNPNDNWLDPMDKPASSHPTPRGSSKKPDDDDDHRYSHVYFDSRGVAHTYGTINMNAVTANGDIGSVTTTSGLSWKIPGRVGDSPLIGAGQYCDNTVGAAGSTGRGEANIKVCGAFLAVEFMRQGMTPQQALMKTMERVIAMTEDRLLVNGKPTFQLQFYAVNKKGDYAGACCYEGSQFAVADSKGARLEECAYMYKKSEQPTNNLSGMMIKP